MKKIFVFTMLFALVLFSTAVNAFDIGGAVQGIQKAVNQPSQQSQPPSQQVNSASPPPPAPATPPPTEAFGGITWEDNFLDVITKLSKAGVDNLSIDCFLGPNGPKVDISNHIRPK
jgi:hypothetical protein